MKKQKQKCECDECFEVVENEVLYETAEGDYICMDCMEKQNDRYCALAEFHAEEEMICN